MSNTLFSYRKNPISLQLEFLINKKINCAISNYSLLALKKDLLLTEVNSLQQPLLAHLNTLYKISLKDKCLVLQIKNNTT